MFVTRCLLYTLYTLHFLRRPRRNSVSASSLLSCVPLFRPLPPLPARSPLFCAPPLFRLSFRVFLGFSILHRRSASHICFVFAHLAAHITLPLSPLLILSCSRAVHSFVICRSSPHCPSCWLVPLLLSGPPFRSLVCVCAVRPSPSSRRLLFAAALHCSCVFIVIATAHLNSLALGCRRPSGPPCRTLPRCIVPLSPCPSLPCVAPLSSVAPFSFPGFFLAS